MNDTMTLSQRADALEQKMSDELDYIVIKSRLYSLAEADTSPAPNAAAIMAKNPRARVLMGDDPRLPAARHLDDRLHPRRPWLLGRAAGRALCRGGSDLGDPRPSGAALLPRRIDRLRVSGILRQDVRRRLPPGCLCRGRLQANARPQMVY